MWGYWLASVRATATAGRCILAHAVGANRYATPSVPVDIAVVHDDPWLGMTANAVDATTPVPASEFAYGECATAVATRAWEFKGDCAWQNSTSVFLVYHQYTRNNILSQVLACALVLLRYILTSPLPSPPPPPSPGPRDQ